MDDNSKLMEIRIPFMGVKSGVVVRLADVAYVFEPDHQPGVSRRKENLEDMESLGSN